MFFIIKEVKDIINYYVLDKEKFYKAYKSDCCYNIIINKDLIFKSKIKTFLLKKKNIVITIFTAYSSVLLFTKKLIFIKDLALDLNLLLLKLYKFYKQLITKRVKKNYLKSLS